MSPKLVDIAGSLYIPVVSPAMSSGGNASAQTAANGTDWTAFASQACAQLTISNDTGATIEFIQGGTGAAFSVFDSTYFTILGITNANQISVRRKDNSTTQVTVKARWEA